METLVELMANINIDLDMLVFAAKSNNASFLTLLTKRQYPKKFLLQLLDRLCQNNAVEATMQVLTSPQLETLYSKYKVDIPLNNYEDFYYIRYTALHVALERGHLNLAKALIDKGATPSVNELWTACDKFNNYEMIRLLLSTGSSIENIDSVASGAYRNGKKDIVNLLAEFGATEGTFEKRQQREIDDVKETIQFRIIVAAIVCCVSYFVYRIMKLI